MTQTREWTSQELMAELNAKLRARDPMHIMKQQLRLKTLGEVRQRVSEQRSTDDTCADVYDRIEAIIRDLEQPVLAG